jgi:hypothetical protein
MAGPPSLVLQETSPGRYELSWTVPSDTDPGTYQVTAHFSSSGYAAQAGATAQLTIQSPQPAVIAPQLGTLPPPVVVSGNVGPGSASVQDLPVWADQLANVFAYAAVFYGITAGLHAVNIKLGWLVAVALLGVAWILRAYLIEPVAGLVKQIILAAFHILVELLDFVEQWIKGVIAYFQGDLIKAVMRILLIAAFLWVWEFAQSIPAIAQLTQNILDGINQVTKFVNDGIDSVLKFLERTRINLEGQLGQALDRMGFIGQQLKSEVFGQVDNLFAGVEVRTQKLRTEILGQVDFIQKALQLQVTIMGQHFRILPDTVRKALLAGYDRTGGAAASDTIGMLLAGPGAGRPADAETMAVWDVAEETRREIQALQTGFVELWIAHARESRAELAAYLRGEPPVMDPWPQKLTPPPDAPLEEIPVPDTPPLPDLTPPAPPGSVVTA